MTDLDARISLHAYGQFGLGLLLLFLGIWTLARGIDQRPFLARRPPWPVPIIPGRIPFGGFLILTSWPVMEYGINRFRDLTLDERMASNNDWNTIVPIYLGLICAAWTVVRFVSNDLGDRDR